MNPLIAFGLLISLISSFFVYYREKKITRALFTFVVVFLAICTPFHFLLVGYYLGNRVNHLIYSRWGSNWGVFIVSILGVAPLFGVWQLLLRLLLVVFVSGFDDPGGVLVFGVGFAAIYVILMLIGLFVYVSSSLIVSYGRRRSRAETVTVS